MPYFAPARQTLSAVAWVAIRLCLFCNKKNTYVLWMIWCLCFRAWLNIFFGCVFVCVCVCVLCPPIWNRIHTTSVCLCVCIVCVWMFFDAMIFFLCLVSVWSSVYVGRLSTLLFVLRKEMDFGYQFVDIMTWKTSFFFFVASDKKRIGVSSVCGELIREKTLIKNPNW